LAVRLIGQTPSGISTEGPFTVFRTGTNEPLLTFSLPFSAPLSNSAALLQFDFGFATSEPDAPDTFFDSFSVTVQRSDQSATALLLTADRTGVQWTPPTSGGVTITPADVRHTNASFPDLNPAHLLRFAYSVSFLLPAPFAGGPLTLFFDLFDNLNQAGSLAFTGNARVESLVLQVAATVNGAYVSETNALWNPDARTFTVPKGSTNSFLRIAGNRTSRLTAIRVVGSQVVVEYQYVQVALQSAAAFNGPYSPETAAVLDEPNRTLTLSKPAGNRFYRLVSDVPTRLKPPRLVGSQMILEYDFRP
jgi:hypothetical protein